ncbi:MAG: trypsin-like serine protease, partial [Dehalococcoidia bacterium]|nr:trypsin-like serine protease [Dehalococcoidia bacterium]
SQEMTQRDFDEAVRQAMAAATPAPSIIAQAYGVIAPSVVFIRVNGPVEGEKPNFGLGAGVVIDDQGIILTANHVIKDAESITVIFANGMESSASVLFREPETDTAVLRADIVPDDLEPATLAGSGGLRLGDHVLAVGSPFGLYNSVTAGVVSGLGRSFKSEQLSEPLTNVIQFDAAVNPGNSGGPLVNRDGEVVGIVTGLLNPSDDVFIGIGFAVPIESAGAAAGPPWD